jgi:hypothetical protein
MNTGPVTLVDRCRKSVVVPMLVLLAAISLSIPPLRDFIEQSMVWHMVIQMPLLVWGGWFLGERLVARRIGAWFIEWNRYGLTGFIVSQLILAYWMIPLTIDRAIVMPVVDSWKVISLIICGAILRHSFKVSPVNLQLFFVGYFVPMMLSLGLYMMTTELRLCNVYSLESQTNAGKGLIFLGLFVTVIWISKSISPRKLT